jgi:serine phosphatase RsbU (regulator of sigma subunit)
MLSPFDRASRLFGLVLAAPLLAILTLPVAVRIARGPDFGFAVHELHIVSVDPDGPAAAAGLAAGDLVTAVGGNGTPTMPAYYAAAAAATGLAPLTVTVERDGAPAIHTVLPRRPTRPSMLRDYSLWTTGLAFLAIGWWVLLQRSDPVTRNFFALCFIFAFFLADIPDLAHVGYMNAKELLRLLLQNLLPAYFVRFFLQFPTPAHRAGGGALLQRLLLLPGILLTVASASAEILVPGPAGLRPHQAIEVLTLIYALVFFIGGLVVFGRRALRRDRPIQRTKMKVVLAGLAAGLGPFLVGTALANVAPSAFGPAPILALSLVFVPASFALAILRYGALDRAFIVRASLTYGVLTLVVVAVFVLVVIGLGSLLSQVFSVSAYPVLLAIAAGSSLAVQPLRRVVQDWIDRTFYPRRGVHRRVFAGLGDELARLVELDEAAAHLVARLRGVFRPSSLVLYLGGEAEQPLQAALDAAAAPPLAADASLARLLAKLQRPVFTEEAEDLLFAGEPDASSLTLLTKLGAVLLVPLVGGNRLTGLLVFGPKPGGALYSQEDLANLRWLALHAGSVLENRRLYRSVIENQRLDAELAVAREIQARLLPTAPLVTPAWSVAGRNDPCRAVGGDYFDYFLRENGHLAVAIADVAGKGVPAALLMATLATSFRNEAEGTAGPAAVVQALNAHMGARMTPGRFVCFFFADLDPMAGLLTYCNAGMDPPVLLRPGRHHERLRKGGPVLGAAPDHVYRQGVVSLDAGDLLFLHTDGLADERNREGEFFDEERLLAEVAADPGASPRSILDRLFRTVADFGSGAESDDKTAILLQINRLRKSLDQGPLLARAAADSPAARPASET